MENNTVLNSIKDPRFYLEHFTKIKTKSGELAPFAINEAQKDLFNTVMYHPRVIILKARQMGFSTAMVGYYYHNTIMRPGLLTALIGYNSDLTSELLEKVKTFFRTTPTELQPTIHYNSRYEISFPRIDSKILVLPSTDNVGRGYTIHNALVTELSSWEKAEEKMMTLEASVPIDGSMVVESTPRGVGNLYHRMWMSPDNGYAKREYGWWWGYDDKEISTIRKRMNNPRMFAQEYDLEFLASGMSVFDPAVTKRIEKYTYKQDEFGVKTFLDKETDKMLTVKEEDGWLLYKQPEPGAVYVLGGDVAEGIEGGDFSVAHIFNRKTGEEVAMFRGRLPADVFGAKLNVMGRRYNNALMCVEINNHGLTTITILKQLAYPSLYFRPSKMDSLGMPISDKIGWKTTRVTRPLLIDDLSQITRDNDLLIHSKELMDEMSVFVYDEKGDAVPQPGFHDDCIFAAAIAVQAFKVIHGGKLEQIDYSDHLPTSFAY